MFFFRTPDPIFLTLPLHFENHASFGTSPDWFPKCVGRSVGSGDAKSATGRIFWIQAEMFAWIVNLGEHHCKLHTMMFLQCAPGSNDIAILGGKNMPWMSRYILRYFNCQLCKFTRLGRFHPKTNGWWCNVSIFASLFPPGEGHFQVNQPLVVFLALCIGSYQPSSRRELAMQNNDAYHEFCLFQTKPIGSIYGVYIYINISTFTIQISHSCRYIWIRPMGIRHGDGVASLLRQEHIVDPLVRGKILLEAAVGLGWELNLGNVNHDFSGDLYFCL